MSREPGRPPGATNKKSRYIRDQKLNMRCTEGFEKTVAQLQLAGNYKSAADVVHEAVKHFALTKNLDKKSLYWINRII